MNVEKMWAEVEADTFARERERKAEQRPVDLGVRPLAELIEEEAQAPPSHYHVDGVLSSDQYGTYAAKPKVGKSFFAQELAVSLTTGTPFMDHYATTSTSVLMFAGEGGRSTTLRRLDAIARAHGVELADIDRLRVSLRAPVVGDDATRRAISCELEDFPAGLIIGEPFYLMGRGVGRGQLNEIGAVLGACQEVAQDSGAALLLGDHWNKTGFGIGADRITGAGMHEWSRIVFSGIVEDTRTDVVTRETVADLRWDIAGELPDLGFKVRRTVRPTDPKDPSSPLEYSCVFMGEHDPSTTRVLSEDAMKLLFELRRRKSTEMNPARSNEVRAAAGVDSRRASEFWRELEEASKIDRTVVTRGSAFDVWLTGDDR